MSAKFSGGFGFSRRFRRFALGCALSGAPSKPLLPNLEGLDVWKVGLGPTKVSVQVPTSWASEAHHGFDGRRIESAAGIGREELVSAGQGVSFIVMFSGGEVFEDAKPVITPQGANQLDVARLDLCGDWLGSGFLVAQCSSEADIVAV